MHLYPDRFSTMPLKEMNEATMDEQVKLLEPELLVLFNKNDLSKHLQAVLAGAGFRSIAKFQRLGSSEQGVEKACKFMGLEPDSLEAMAEIAGLQAAWESARAVKEAEDRARAERLFWAYRRP